MKQAGAPRRVGQVDVPWEAVLGALHEYGLKAELKQPGRAGDGVDALVRIRHGGQQVTYVAEFKRGMTPAQAGAVAARLRAQDKPALLIADYVSPPLADRLKAMDVAFADAAGNAYLRGKNFLVCVTGRRPAERLRPPRARRAYQPAGLKLLFALLCNPLWVDLGYRQLAHRSGVANGTVQLVMRELADDGFVLEARAGRIRRRLRNRRMLMDRWVEAYLRTLRPATLIGRYQADKPDWWKHIDPRKYDAQLGGEPGGAVLTRHLTPETVTLYARGKTAPLILENGLRAVQDGNVELRERFWTFDHDGGHPELTPPLLIYADLLAAGDARCIETAERVFDGDLARLVGKE